MISVEGVLADVTYPHLSHGRVADLFDADSFTLARTLENEPVRRSNCVSGPRELTGIEVALATMQPHVTVKVTEPGHRAPLVFRQKLDEVRTEPRLSIPFGRTLTAVAVEVAVRDVRRSGDDQVHIAELTFLP